MKEVQGREGEKDQSEYTFCNGRVVTATHSLIGLVYKVHHNYFIKYNPTTLVYCSQMYHVEGG